MYFNLGLSTVAQCVHQHELYPNRESMDQKALISHPLQYLHTQIQAFNPFFPPAAVPPPHEVEESAPSSITDDSPTPETTDAQEAESPSLDALSELPASIRSARRRSMRRSTTSFQLARPPPTTKGQQLFKLRPRTPLQLRQITDGRRPIPAYDVLASLGSAPKLAKRFPRILYGRAGLGVDDLVVLKSPNYGKSISAFGQVDDSSDDEDWESREVVAAIRHVGASENGAREQVQISLNHGSPWMASANARGGYDFVSVPEGGLEITARWMPKTSKTLPVLDQPSENTIQGLEEKKFKFSILNADTHQRPVIGVMDRSTIDVFNQHGSLSTPTMSPTIETPPVRSFSPPTSPQAFSFRNFDERPEILVNTTDDLKTLVIVTGIWVAFAEGWTELTRHPTRSSGSVNSVRGNSPFRTRTASTNLENGSDRAHTPQSFGSFRSRHTSLGMMHRPTASTNSRPTSPKSETAIHRANSSGASYLRNSTPRSSSLSKFAPSSNLVDGVTSPEIVKTHSPSRVGSGSNENQSTPQSPSATLRRSSTYGDNEVVLVAEQGIQSPTPVEFPDRNVTGMRALGDEPVGKLTNGSSGGPRKKNGRMKRFRNIFGKKDKGAS